MFFINFYYVLYNIYNYYKIPGVLFAFSFLGCQSAGNAYRVLCRPLLFSSVLLCTPSPCAVRSAPAVPAPEPECHRRLCQNRLASSRSLRLIMRILNPGKQSLKNSSLRSPLSISRNLPEMFNRYLRLKKRRGHKKAIIVIARMLLTALYHMLKNSKTIIWNFTGNHICLQLTVRSMWNRLSS